MSILKLTVIKFILILLLPLCCQAVFAEEPIKDNNTYLKVARTQLDIAFDNYNKGDISVSKKHLKSASEWLYKAVNHSRSDTVRDNAQKLVTEIDSFRLTLNKSSEKNDMARFWHQVSSLIKREAEHLIHSYTESSTNNRIMRLLLDAKMHFFNADHDIFLSHDTNDVSLELGSSIEYLRQAEALAKSEFKPYVHQLIISINELIPLSASDKNTWEKNTLIDSLEESFNNLSEAQSLASPPTKMRLETIKQSISILKKDVQKTSLKLKYESIMVDFSRAINNI